MNGITLTIRPELARRLDTLARRSGLTTGALAHLLLEAAVNYEERLFAREQRAAKDLEAILVRAIRRGDYDPATSGAQAPRGRSGPPGGARRPVAAATPDEPGSAGPSLGGGRRHESTPLYDVRL